MVDTRFSRLATPVRARNGITQVSRPRASSVPAEGTHKPEWMLDCAFMSPRKRKHTNTREESLPSQASQAQGARNPQPPQQGREVRKAPGRAARPRARGLSSADREIVAAGLASSSRASSRTRSASRTASVDGRPRRRCASTSRAQSEAPPARSPYVFGGQGRRMPGAKARRLKGAGGSGKSASASALRRADTPLVAASRRAKSNASSGGRQEEKSRARALFEDDMSSLTSLDESQDAGSSVSGRSSNAKRRRLSPRPLASLATSSSVCDDEDDSQRTAVEEDFEMLESPECLPWVPMNPDSKDSEYVPPGLNALIDDMKRALVLQISARQKAENMHAAELQRRLQLEREAARLAAANRALEAERSARAADSLANTLKNARISDFSQRPPVVNAPAEGNRQAPASATQ
ncbi:hypothetical protein BD309DRAFT_851128 [Dichomitus squalens]|nr:hypothetical protein BD309DRAFT_851128 [Dichomitus squalens]